MDVSKLEVTIPSELYFEMKRKIDTLNDQLEQQLNFHAILNNDLISASQKLDAAEKELKAQKQEFDAYRETAEEISRCYNDSHSDSWVFEEALRRIANRSLFLPHNVGPPNDREQQKIALEALEKVWTRRMERSKVVRT